MTHFAGRGIHTLMGAASSADASSRRALGTESLTPLGAFFSRNPMRAQIRSSLQRSCIWLVQRISITSPLGELPAQGRIFLLQLLHHLHEPVPLVPQVCELLDVA